MTQLREAIEASWKPDTAYLEVSMEGNPALGQCYPTSRVFQFFFPESEIVEGAVKTIKGMEKHFWNVIESGGVLCHIDFTWQQFPPGSRVVDYKIRNRNTLNDSQKTIDRVELLNKRVTVYLAGIVMTKLVLP